MLGKIVKVVVDRPMGSSHPKYKWKYPINYGYVPGILGGDGEEQDAYVLGVEEPVTEFAGRVIAVIHRKNDNETKWVVAPMGRSFTKKEIEKATYFQERYFEIEIEI